MTDQSPVHPHARGRARIRERVLAGETLFGAFASLGNPAAAELLARAGFDWIIVDIEHGAGTESDIAAQIYAIESAGDLGGSVTAALVRPEEGTRLRVGRVLDAGAEGVMIPRLESADDVRQVVSWFRYPPDGVRGLALGTRGAEQSEVAHADVASLNRRVLGIFQIESGPAAGAADAIAAVDGADVLFVGPTDLSHSLGVPGRFEEPVFRDALGAVVAACRANGKSAGILLSRLGDLELYLGLGFTFVGLGSDASFVKAGGRAAIDAARTRAGA